MSNEGISVLFNQKCRMFAVQFSVAQSAEEQGLGISLETIYKRILGDFFIITFANAV
jgi:hypothetical protein